jgi:hypothetical protein
VHDDREARRAMAALTSSVSRQIDTAPLDIRSIRRTIEAFSSTVVRASVSLTPGGSGIA